MGKKYIAQYAKGRLRSFLPLPIAKTLNAQNAVPLKDIACYIFSF